MAKIQVYFLVEFDIFSLQRVQSEINFYNQEDKMQLFPNNPDRWERIWQRTLEKSPIKKRMFRSDDEQIKKWDMMAEWFFAKTRGKEAEKRRGKIIEKLKQEGALIPGIKVLDVGAGPGNWSIQLAQIADHVTAIEPSSEMVNIFNKRISSKSVKNINILQRRWEEIDIEKDGLKGQYDLVIASMTPGVNNREVLEKLMNASCGYCYMSIFSGQGRLQVYKELWQLIFKESIGENPNDIIYPFNLLYAMGYRPVLWFSTWGHTREMKIAEAVEDIMAFLWQYMDDTPEIRAVVEQYVDENAVSGKIKRENEICQGHMLWKIV